MLISLLTRTDDSLADVWSTSTSAAIIDSNSSASRHHSNLHPYHLASSSAASSTAASATSSSSSSTLNDLPPGDATAVAVERRTRNDGWYAWNIRRHGWYGGDRWRTATEKTQTESPRKEVAVHAAAHHKRRINIKSMTMSYLPRDDNVGMTYISTRN